MFDIKIVLENVVMDNDECLCSCIYLINIKMLRFQQTVTNLFHCNE